MHTLFPRRNINPNQKFFRLPWLFFGGGVFFVVGCLHPKSIHFKWKLGRKPNFQDILDIWRCQQTFQVLKMEKFPHLNNLYGCKAYVMENPPPKIAEKGSVPAFRYLKRLVKMLESDWNIAVHWQFTYQSAPANWKGGQTLKLHWLRNWQELLEPQKVPFFEQDKTLENRFTKSSTCQQIPAICLI